MLAARIATSAFACSRGTLKTTCLSTSKSSQMNLVRGYREAGRSFTRKARISRIVEAQASETANTLKTPLGPIAVGQAAAAGGAVLGLGALCYYGLGLSNEMGAIDRIVIWPDHVKARIRDTYLYFGASCAATAASAVSIYRSAAGQRFFALCSRHPIMSTVGIIAGLMGTGTVMMSVPYTPGVGTKQMLWLLNCGMLGLAVAPMAAVGGAIAIRAGWYTAGIVGGLSTIAVCAPSDKFMNWGAPLGMGLGAVFAASIGSAFLPPTTRLGVGLYSFALYGGLLLFSAFLVYDTQKIIRRAESHPPYGVVRYDPINSSHRIVMDTLNIFVRMVQILAMGGGMSRRK